MSDTIEEENVSALTADVNLSKVLSRYGEYLSDIAFVDYTAGGTITSGFSDTTEMFNDNVTLALPTGMSVRNGFRTLRDIFGAGATIVRGSGGGGEIRVICGLPGGLTPEQFRDIELSRIRLVDIDYTVDARNITTRTKLLEYLISLGPVEIADRGEKAVGRNCLSWWAVDADGDRVRIKVYNTFAHILESAGVRVLLGSNVHSLLNGSVKADTLLRHKDHGVSRIELTFYSDTFKPISVYRTMVMNVASELLAGCPTYCNSLSRQWATFQTNIHQTAAVYHVETSTFAYCHWWNSLTKMMQGGSSAIRNIGELPKLLGNYSFYERDMHLITIADDGETSSTFARVPGGSPITMCCGPKGGLYPSGPSRILVDYGDGVGNVGTGYLGWPLTYTYRSRPLASVEERPDDIGSLVEQMESLTIINRDYKPAFTGLEVGRRYVVCGSGVGNFRGTDYVYVKLDDGSRVRCGPSLEQLVRDHMNNGNVKFSFIVDRKVNNSGWKDAVCFTSTSPK